MSLVPGSSMARDTTPGIDVPGGHQSSRAQMQVRAITVDRAAPIVMCACARLERVWVSCAGSYVSCTSRGDVSSCAHATITLGLSRDAPLHHLIVDLRARADRDNALGGVQQGNPDARGDGL